MSIAAWCPTMTTDAAFRSHKLVAFVATSKPAISRNFYRDTLGLRLVSEDGFALVFDANGTMLRVSIVKDVRPAQYTVLGWEVLDIVAAAKRLQEAGVQLERYPGMGQDEHGVWKSPGGAAIAWFKDPDGNTLSLTQF
jgi:catechol 2,3-dioxygenase-like lactoylglutathione lyase family enzyme